MERTKKWSVVFFCIGAVAAVLFVLTFLRASEGYNYPNEQWLQYKHYIRMYAFGISSVLSLCAGFALRGIYIDVNDETSGLKWRIRCTEKYIEAKEQSTDLK
jgi:hypothetical protein